MKTLKLIVTSGLSVLLCTAAHAVISAETILQQTGIQGGLIVHLDCGNGELTASLRVNEKYLVQVGEQIARKPFFAQNLAEGNQ